MAFGLQNQARRVLAYPALITGHCLPSPHTLSNDSAPRQKLLVLRQSLLTQPALVTFYPPPTASAGCAAGEELEESRTEG